MTHLLGSKLYCCLVKGPIIILLCGILEISRRSWWVYSTDNTESTAFQLPVGRRSVSGDHRDEWGRVPGDADVRGHDSMRCDRLAPGGAQANYLHTQALFFFAAARDKRAQETCQPRSSDGQLNGTDGEARPERKDSYPLPIWWQITEERQCHGWLAVFLIMCQASRHTAHFQLPSHTAPGRLLNTAIACVSGRKGFLRGSFLASGSRAWTDHSLSSTAGKWFSVLKEEEETNAGLFLPHYMKGELTRDWWKAGWGNLSSLAWLPSWHYFIHWHGEVLALIPNLYRRLTIYMWGAVLSIYMYELVYSSQTLRT